MEPRIGFWQRQVDAFWFLWRYLWMPFGYRDALHGLAATFAGEPIKDGWHYQCWIEEDGSFCGVARPLDPETGDPKTYPTSASSANGTVTTTESLNFRG